MADNNPLYNVSLPKYSEAPITPQGLFARPWYKFFQDFFENTVKLIDLALLMSQVDSLQNLVSQLIAKNTELEQSVAAIQSALTDAEDVKRRLINLENFESMRMTHGYLDS